MVNSILSVSLTTVSLIRVIPAVHDAVTDLAGEEFAPEEVGAGAVLLVRVVTTVLHQVTPRELRDALTAATPELRLVGTQGWNKVEIPDESLTRLQ